MCAYSLPGRAWEIWSGVQDVRPRLAPEVCYTGVVLSLIASALASWRNRNQRSGASAAASGSGSGSGVRVYHPAPILHAPGVNESLGAFSPEITPIVEWASSPGPVAEVDPNFRSATKSLEVIHVDAVESQEFSSPGPAPRRGPGRSARTLRRRRV
eukprot:IDg7196t1